MVFSVAELIAFISASITLEPGDLVDHRARRRASASSASPPVFLVPGDVVRVEVEGIGAVANPIVDAAGEAPAGSPAARLLAARDGPASGSA